MPKKQLLAERTKCETANNKAQRMRMYFGNAVAVSLAREMASKLLSLEAEAAELRSVICGLQLPGNTVPTDISNAVFTPRAENRHSEPAKVAWQQLLLALRSNPDASIDSPT